MLSGTVRTQSLTGMSSVETYPQQGSKSTVSTGLKKDKNNTRAIAQRPDTRSIRLFLLLRNVDKL
jgi:hypothetical protein